MPSKQQIRCHFMIQCVTIYGNGTLNLPCHTFSDILLENQFTILLHWIGKRTVTGWKNMIISCDVFGNGPYFKSSEFYSVTMYIVQQCRSIFLDQNRLLIQIQLVRVQESFVTKLWALIYKCSKNKCFCGTLNFHRNKFI